MRYLCIIIIIIPVFLIAQNNVPLELNIGYGYYEAINAGMKYNKNDFFKIDISFGYDNHIIFKEKYYSVISEFDLAILKKKTSLNGYNKWFINNKVFYWHLEDDFYKWDVLALSPSFNRNFYLTSHFYLSADIGPVINIVLKNHRKTFEQVGWPYHIYPNFRLLLNYKL